MRAIDITAENAKALRELFRQSIETYSAFENLQKLINETVHGDYWTHAFGEFAALSRGSDRIEVVAHAEYLNDTNKIRRY